ncbi:ketopantoate reductase family protein [Streptomyces pseudogriseolus]|uniref:2-dehydropantoate 2-reductase n=3 Tax=Streptomyces pseudogriseolus TaxID=36817 RepID=M3DLW4_STREZ|nr:MULTISPECIES: 2-dehydropantoate 2-reductase [Streptomyces]EMF30975.1 2-dehydropantoate 2-reductase [Streptomyces gancidicus BKS 13-15]MCI4146458.1 2-dehydropantoate 2-reductase [Streptomyces sp. MMS20-AI2-20]GGQ05682.1 2-dehydropantoate 2-reductase [Streptomyces gancidicus]GGS62285.1 2-dehydropantoate 2-reductase [Streptomyces rubiginosus]
MRIAIVGAGGVGGYFGARLAAADHEVTFVARGRHLEAVRRSGLLVRSPLGDVRTSPGAVVESVADVDGADLVVVAVKLWDTEDVARQLAASKLAGTPVLSLQNGVHKDTVLARHLPAASLLGGACFISAFIEEPGVVRHNGTLQRMVFGARRPEQEPVARQLLQACAEAGIDADVSEDVDRVIWEKYVFLVGHSATTTAVRRPIGVVRSDARTRTLLRDVMAEVVAVARASGIALPEDFADRQLAFCDTLPADMTSSMHNDLEHGHRLELPWLSGGVADLADGLGVPAPRNRTVADILSPYVDGAPASA